MFTNESAAHPLANRRGAGKVGGVMAKKRSKRREKARDAAEEVCRKVREDIADKGFVAASVFPYLDRWMRLSGKRSRYAKPVKVKGQ